MSLAVLSLAFTMILILGYHFYGRFIAKQYALNDQNPTPATAINDGEDFVPTKPFYLLGQHFSAIAAAGPIAGPIIACQAFGWLPCILWIGLGVIFIGAVHDFSALIASVRYQARSIAEVVKENIGKRAWIAMTAFIWLALVYVIVAFADITASTFVGKSEEFEGGKFFFNPGGAVAASSVLYMLLAIVMGLLQRYLKVPLWLLTVIFVPGTLGAVWLGTKVSSLLLFDQKTWGMMILAYCFVASILPVWLLLQPRGYLGGFVLYLALGIGVAGIFWGGFGIEQEAFKTWAAPGTTGTLFPFLFVTIACGACSGFHGLVCSGTTSKQISQESHCKPVGYGGMLLEGFVALISLATIMIVSSSETKGLSPGVIYGNGLAHFLTKMIGEEHFLFASTFGAMAFSTFVFDTLDVSTRLGRYVLQELFGLKGKQGAMIATALTLLLPAIFILLSKEGAYRLYWTLFGTSNQLLAALTLLGITVWLYQSGKRYWFTLVPMFFVMTITTWSLVLQIGHGARLIHERGFEFNPITINAVISVALILLAATQCYEAGKIFFLRKKG